ncbi:MAG: tyrosine-protein phosphatase [Desulfovibrio sp.]|jgi:protein tyrosine phosphatase (PTP) superfamily phosphohydrolase (DUF442 family)|nr:tyrosine-protein phosphatase [Desulfovibrio sp.]
MRCRYSTLGLLPLLLLCHVLSAAACANARQVGEYSAATRNLRWAEPLSVEGLPNLFRVTSELYRSAQPGKTGMVNANRMGIKTVLSLRVSDEDPELSQGTGLFLRQVPIYTWNIGEDEIVSALRVIRDTAGPVLVHCRHGADRTGLIIAMYRMVFQDWSKEEAKEEMLDGGYGFHSVWTNIPKLIEQSDIASIRARVQGTN